MNIKKTIAGLFLVGIIIGSFGFVWLKFSANGAENNYFNTRWRASFSQSFFWRQVLGLHYDGDARSDFLGKKYQKILLKVAVGKGLYIGDEMLRELTEKIARVTGKPTDYIYLPEMDLEKETSIEELGSNIIGKMKNVNSNNQANLFLLVAYQNKERPENIGSTVRENGIVLFENDLGNNYKLNSDVEVFDRYALGVLLHEVGHQLGLQHNQRKGCLMNAQTEISNLDRAKDVLTDFCEEELAEIGRIADGY